MMSRRCAMVSVAVFSSMTLSVLTPGDRPGLTSPAHAAGLAGMDGQGHSSVFVQNLDLSSTTRLGMTVYGRKDQVVGLSPRNLVAGGQYVYDFSLPGPPSGTYTAIASSDQAISTIVRTEWPMTGGAIMSNASLAGTDIVVPFAAKGYYGQMSLISIQNTVTNTQVTATLEFFTGDQTTPIAETSVTIAPGYAAYVDLGLSPDFATVPTGSVGYARVRSTTPVAVLSAVDFERWANGVHAFEGLPAERASARLFAPMVNAGPPPDFGGGGHFLNIPLPIISIVNPGDETVEVRIRYDGVAGSCPGRIFHHPPFSLAGRTSVRIAPGPVKESVMDTGIDLLPAGCTASATIEASGGGILATVVDTQLMDPTGLRGKVNAQSYNALTPDQGSTTVLLPLIRRRYGDVNLTTAIQVMNLADQPAAVSIRFRDGQGRLVEGCTGCAVMIRAGGGHLWWPADIPELGDNLSGSALVTSDQPVGVVVNDISAIRAVDMASYVGIGVPSDLADGSWGRSFAPTVLAGNVSPSPTLAWRRYFPRLVLGP